MSFLLEDTLGSGGEERESSSSSSSSSESEGEDPMQVEAARLRKEQETLQRQAEEQKKERDRARQQRRAAKELKKAEKAKSRSLGAEPTMSSTAVQSTPVRPDTVTLDNSLVREEVHKPPQKKKKKAKKNASSSSDSDNENSSFSAFMKLVKKKAKSSKRKKGKKSKKRSRSSSSSDDSSMSEDEAELLVETVSIRDDGISEVNMDIRAKLRPPTGAPETWWKAPFKSAVSLPVRGASLNVEPAMGHGRVHDATIKRLHHRTSAISLRMLLTRNSDVHIRDTRVMRVEGDKVSMDRKWAAPEQTWEVAEAISNYVTLIHYIRSYSYEALALHRALHDYGWLLACVENEAEQILHLENSIDLVLARNRQRARDGRHPLTYEDIRLVVRGYLNSKGKYEPGLYGK